MMPAVFWARSSDGLRKMRKAASDERIRPDMEVSP
jgi:hypothetical protein